MIYTPSDIVVREIGGGAWFFMSFALGVAFIGYVVRQRWIFSQREFTPVTKTAVALALFSFGSAMRAFLTWMQFLYLDNGWDARYWIDTWPWFGASIILNIIGAEFCVWVLTPAKWRVCTTFFTAAVSILVPLFIYWYL
jgi:hypothetical protein